LLALPRVVAQVGNLGLNLLSLLEDLLEILSLHPVCQVDVSADLSLVALVSDEQNRRESAIAKTFLSSSKCLQEQVALKVERGVSQRLHLGLLLVLARLDCGLLSLFKLLSSQKLSLSVASDLVKLADELCVFQVKEVRIGTLVVQVFLIVCVIVEVGIEQVSFVVLCHSSSFFSYKVLKFNSKL